MKVFGKAPGYAEFEDYRYTQQVVVAVRWFLLISWLVVNHWHNTFNANLIAVDGIGIALVAMNAWLHYRIRRHGPLPRALVISASLLDIGAISAGISITNGINNTFFVLYYPALIGLALVLSSPRLLVIATSVTAAAYACIAAWRPPGLDISDGDDRRLAVRVIVMFASALAAQLILLEERRRRREAVELASHEAEENLRLQVLAQQAELDVAQQRFRIGREIHDGVVQNLYGLTLNLETALTASQRGDTAAAIEHLPTLVQISKQALLETRHYMHDLRPLLAQGGDLCQATENLVSEFRDISGLDVEFTTKGERQPVPEETAVQSCRIVQEALSNVLRHATATSVTVGVSFHNPGLTIEVVDDGRGFDSNLVRGGQGLGNMRSRAADIDGTLEIASRPGAGTRVTVQIPLGGTASDAHQSDDRR